MASSDAAPSGTSSSSEKCRCSVTVVSFNIDGLDERFIAERASGVCDIIDEERADVVLLQEVVAESLQVLLLRFSSTFEIYAPGADLVPYYPALLVRKATFSVPADSFSLVDFENSRMGRHLLVAKNITHKQTDHRLAFLTSHLESLQKGSGERKRQLTRVYNKMNELRRDGGCTTVFGADTNLREHEMKAVPMPRGIVDAWYQCFSPEESKYTFDLLLNDNLTQQWPGPPTRTQYDKIFIGRDGHLLPAEFRLLGKTRLPCGLFPSDHFGILTRITCTGCPRDKK